MITHDDNIDPRHSDAVRDNYVQTFQLESSNLRGRVVKLGGALDQIITAHKYPNAVSQMVAETVTLTAALSSMLKYEGVFTLQTQGDGSVRMLVSDVTSTGVIRGCASFDVTRVENAIAQLSVLAENEGSQNALAQLLGKGYMAFTVDQPGSSDRYQGIVELKGASLADSVRHYFKQSEQIGTGIKMAVGVRDGHWRAGAIMLQHLPEDQKNPAQGLGNVAEDDWRRAMILQDTCSEDELLDAELDTDELLFRLFYEEGVRVYDRKSLRKGCRCDDERVKNVLSTLSVEDIEFMANDGRVTMTCEFCSKEYSYLTEEALKLLKGK